MKEMGDRYFITEKCPKCGVIESDIYFAPTCGFTTWKCKSCGEEIDLCKLTGIEYEDASNLDLISKIIDGLK